MRQVQFPRTLVASAVGAICAAQTPAGAGNLLINGSLASGGVATMAAQQKIGFTSAGNIAAVVFTITGTDDQNRTISETVTGVNANTVQTVLDYRTVTSIANSAALAAAVTVDTVGTGASSVVPLDQFITAFNVTVAVEVSGVVNYTVQQTIDNIFSGPGPFNWTSVAALQAQTTNQQANLTAPVRAVRIVNNSGQGTATFIVVQTGLT